LTAPTLLVCKRFNFMANKRYITTNFWRDRFIDELDSTEKLLFLYLICNPSTNLCGIYQSPLRLIASDTGIEEKSIENIFKKFSEKKRAYYIDGWVVLPNAPKHQELKNDRICIGIERELANVSEKVIEAIDKLSIPYTYSMDRRTALRLELRLKLRPRLRLKPNGIYSSDFEKFFSSYPNKVGKKYTSQCWEKLNPDKTLVRVILEAVEKQKQSRKWKEGFITNPSTFINQERWEDGPEPEQKKPIVVKSKSL